MNFTITEEQQSAQQLAQQILSDFTEVDKLKTSEQQESFDAGLWQALATAGLLGLDIAEDQGGTGLGFYSLTTLCEEVGRTVAPVPIIPVLVSAAGTLRRFASDTQKDQWLPGIASGATLIGAVRRRRVLPRWWLTDVLIDRSFPESALTLHFVRRILLGLPDPNG